MGTLREEMSKVLNEWDKQDQQIETTLQENTVTKKITTTQKIINLIAANAGISSLKIRQLVIANHPDIPEGNISSVLTQLSDRYVLSRTDSGQRVNGKTIYSYTVTPEDEAKRLREEAEKKLKAAQARAEKAREAKAAKQIAREEERTGLSDLLHEKVEVPTRIKRFVNIEPTPVQPWTARQALEGLNILQARELYDELKKIFGGN